MSTGQASSFVLVNVITSTSIRLDRLEEDSLGPTRIGTPYALLCGSGLKQSS
jgi:hypothetical protein